MDIASICAIFLGYVPHSPPEESLSQNFDLGPGYFFLCYVEILEKYVFIYYLRFMSFDKIRGSPISPYATSDTGNSLLITSKYLSYIMLNLSLVK